jgi:triacylglycerol lipase
LNYWGRIPETLQKNGAVLFYGNQDSHGSVESNAAQIKAAIEKALTETGVEKVNLIAHSKGGLDARYAITRLNMRDKVASLTTLATPHHGSLTVDKLLRLPDGLIQLAAWVSNIWYRLLGDKTPDAYQAYKQFSTAFSAEFNENTPDCPGVFYQSYAFVMHNARSDIFLIFPFLLVNLIEGESDGLVTPRSAAWTNFKGVVKSASKRGISHCDGVDMRRRRFTKRVAAGCVSDITDFYLELVRNLKQCGF